MIIRHCEAGWALVIGTERLSRQAMVAGIRPRDLTHSPPRQDFPALSIQQQCIGYSELHLLGNTRQFLLLQCSSIMPGVLGRTSDTSAAAVDRKPFPLAHCPQSIQNYNPDMFPSGESCRLRLLAVRVTPRLVDLLLGAVPFVLRNGMLLPFLNYKLITPSPYDPFALLF